MTVLRLVVSAGIVGFMHLGFAAGAAFVVRAPENALLVLLVGVAILMALRPRESGRMSDDAHCEGDSVGRIPASRS